MMARKILAGMSLFSPKQLFANGEQGVLYRPGLDTCYTDNGITPCTAAGDLVYRMDDLSGNGHHAVQVTAARRPLLQQDGNGHWYLKFDGADDFLALPNIPFTTDIGLEVYAGVDTTNLPNDYRILIQRNSSAPGETPGIYMGSGASNYKPCIYDGDIRALNVLIQGPYAGTWRVSLLSGNTRRAITRVNRAQVSQDYARIIASNEVLNSINASASLHMSRFALYGLVIRCAPLVSDSVRDQTEDFMANLVGVTLP